MTDSDAFGGALTRVRELERAGDIQGIERMLNNPLERGTMTIRGSAAAALGRLGRQDSGDALLSAGDDESRDVRMNVAIALGMIRYTDAVAWLCGRAADSDEFLIVRQAAVRSLGQIGADSARPALSAALDSDDVWTRLYAAEGLSAMTDPELADRLPDLISRETRFMFGRRRRWQAIKQRVSASAHAPEPRGG